MRKYDCSYYTTVQGGLYDICKEERKSTRIVRRQKREPTIATVNGEAPFKNSTSSLSYPHLLLLFQFYFLSTWLSVVKRPQHLGENKYCFDCIDCTTHMLVQRGLTIKSNIQLVRLFRHVSPVPGRRQYSCHMRLYL